MIPIMRVRRRRVMLREGRRLVLLAAFVAVLPALVSLASGCSSVPEAVGTPAPAGASSSVVAVPVWPNIGLGEAPLFDLNVTEADGFTAAERDYLRGERMAWDRICNAAEEYSSTVTSDPDAASDLLTAIELEGGTAAAAPSPSSRFEVLQDTVSRLMDRVVSIARAAQSYQDAATSDETNAAAAQLVRLSTPLPNQLLHVSDWGLALYYQYGGVDYPVYVPAAAAPVVVAPAETTPTTTTTSSSSEPGSQPPPEPEPQPQPTMTSAEAKQVKALTELDAWLTPVVTDSLALVDAQSLPWDEAEVESFCLNMTYLQDQTALWLGKSPAGNLVAPGFKEYQKGLSLAQAGAKQLGSAAQYNDTGRQKALDKGAKTLESALSYLNGGMAKLGRLQ